MYRVIVSLGAGSLDRGFESISVTLIDPHGNQQLKRIGHLPANPELIKLYQQWKQLYRGYYINNNRPPYRLEFVPDAENPYFFSEQEFYACCTQLQLTLDQWLAQPGFAGISNFLRSRLDHQQCFQWIIESADSLVQHLPWHLWSFFKDFPQAEVAMSLPEFEQIIPSSNLPSNKLKILVILGKSVNDLGDDINVQVDRRIIESTPQVSAVFINKTSRTELSDLLWEQSWDVILFAGHSSGSGPTGKAGFLLNSDEPHNIITIHELESSFRTAIKQGLKLVIFNSCDSFELGLDLMRLNLPQCIAMSEAIPDAVAQRFLRYLVQQWHVDDSFVVAVRSARARLKESEDPLFPCASWLPVICQNPAAMPPAWPTVQDEPDHIQSSPPQIQSPPQSSSLVKSLMGGLGLLACLTGIRFSGGLEFLELNAFDHFHQLSPPESHDDNILLITISDADIQYQDRQEMPRRGSLSDQALEQLLIKLKPLNPKAIAVDIFHDFAYSPELQTIVQDTPKFISVCEVGFSSDQSGSIAPPPSMPLQQIGFADFVLDQDDTVRRQLLRMTESEACPTDYSLGLKLAEIFIGETVQESNASGNLTLSHLHLPRLNTNAGGYSLPSGEADGYQIMTRYRRASFRQLSLREILSGTSTKLKEWGRERLVIIGIKQRNRDSLHTPTKLREQGKLTGVEIHAHMTSQLIQGVEEGRPLIWWWPEWLEYSWISLWVMIGVMVLYWIRNPVVAFGLLSGMIAIATLICYGTFLIGGWIPWVPVVLGLVPITVGAGFRFAQLRFQLNQLGKTVQDV